MTELNTIYKYPIPLENGPRWTIEIPALYSILHIENDPSGVLCLWAAVNTKEERSIPLEIVCIGTGHHLPRVGSFICTWKSGAFVWHFFTGPGNDRGFSHENFAYLTRMQP